MSVPQYLTTHTLILPLIEPSLAGHWWLEDHWHPISNKWRMTSGSTRASLLFICRMKAAIRFPAWSSKILKKKLLLKLASQIWFSTGCLFLYCASAPFPLMTFSSARSPEKLIWPSAELHFLAGSKKSVPLKKIKSKRKKMKKRDPTTFS